jgi:hypothetical protein
MGLKGLPRETDMSFDEMYEVAKGWNKRRGWFFPFQMIFLLVTNVYIFFVVNAKLGLLKNVAGID